MTDIATCPSRVCTPPPGNHGSATGNHVLIVQHNLRREIQLQQTEVHSVIHRAMLPAYEDRTPFTPLRIFFHETEIISRNRGTAALLALLTALFEFDFYDHYMSASSRWST